MKNKLIIASNNPYKTHEMIQILNAYGMGSYSYKKLINKCIFPEEGETSYQRNVNAKALFISEKVPDQLVIADDSGIVLDACPDKLGVTTSRELSPYMPDYVDHMLNMVKGKSRHYTMKSFTTIAKAGKVVATGEGILIGQLAKTPQGDKRDGFDSILMPEGLNKTLNQLSWANWLRYAHRSKAVKNVLIKAGLLTIK